MANMKPPSVPVESRRLYSSDDQLNALIKASSGGSSFDARRDKAIILVLLDTGVRL